MGEKGNQRSIVDVVVFLVCEREEDEEGMRELREEKSYGKQPRRRIEGLQKS